MKPTKRSVWFKYFIRMAVLKTLSCTGASDSWIRLISLKPTAAAILSRRWCFTCMVCMKNGYNYHDPWSANGGLARLHWELGLEVLETRRRDLVACCPPCSVSSKRKIGLSCHPSPDHFQVTFIPRWSKWTICHTLLPHYHYVMNSTVIRLQIA